MSMQIKKLAEELGQQLLAQHLTLITAESCTGGGLSYWITSIPGSSAWFDRGFVTYSDLSKTELLGIPGTLIHTYGAVSEETARAMAKGALSKSPTTDISIAITGIAGPGGGSAQKPVGTVWIAWGTRDGHIIAELNHFPGDRQAVRDATMIRALQKLTADILQKKR